MSLILKTASHHNRKILEIIFSLNSEEDPETGTKLPLGKEEDTKVKEEPDTITTVYEYPFVWLRDNCQCDRCFQPAAKSRILLVRDLDVNDHPTSTTISDDRLLVTVTWSSGHVSCYGNTWLLERRFSSDVSEERERVYELPAKYWGSELQGKVKQDTFSNLMTDDRALYQWTVELEETGIFLVKDAVPNEDSVGQLAKRVAYLRRTNYGENFRVEHKPNPSNAAYTGVSLGLHTDLPFYQYTPGIQMLHCLKQSSEGGANEFCDGFRVANQLRDDDPGTFRILSETLVDYVDVGTDAYTFDLAQRKPIIQLDNHGNVNRINYNNMVRHSVLNLAPDDVYNFYVAMRKFNDFLYDAKNVIELKLTGGDIICFHNYRVLHGRQGYQISGDQQRLLVGGYIDWDELRSRRRLLKKTLTKK